MARPSDYSPELAKQICRKLMEGLSLRKICDDPQMPCKATVFNWLASGSHPEFLDQYARAREIQAEHRFDELIDLSEELEDAQLGKLRLDTIKWVLSRQNPKKYGDRLQTDNTTRSTVQVSEVTPEEAKAINQALEDEY